MKLENMTKLIIGQALTNAIGANGLHHIALNGGSENAFSIPMVNYIPFCFPQVQVPNPHGGSENIDNITYINAARQNVEWALEAKHFTPHQMGTLIGYQHWSVGGCIIDILKLIDCGFQKFYIVQLQTEVTQFSLLAGTTYNQLCNQYQAFPKYISKLNVAAANKNIHRVVAQNRIQELEIYSRQRLDSNLICDHLPLTITSPIAIVDVTLHYLVSGPFYYTNLYPRLAALLNPALPFEGQVGERGQVPTWDVDVSIASNPNA